MAASVSAVERFDRADFAGRDAGAAGAEWNFKELLRMDHPSIRGTNAKGKPPFQPNTSASIEVSL
jgi:hypothetical protein